MFAEILATMFVFGSMWFWLTACVLFFVVLAFSENEHNFLAAVSVGLFAYGVSAYNDINLTFGMAVLLFVVYMILGGGWSFAKWFSFIRQRADRFVELKEEWVEKYNQQVNDNGYHLSSDFSMADLNKDQSNLFKRFLYENRFFNKDVGNKTVIIPSAKDNKERIVTWILWWPTSAFWTLLNDPLVRLANWMYFRFSTVYEKISNRVFKSAGVTSADKFREGWD